MREDVRGRRRRIAPDDDLARRVHLAECSEDDREEHRDAGSARIALQRDALGNRELLWLNRRRLRCFGLQDFAVSTR